MAWHSNKLDYYWEKYGETSLHTNYNYFRPSSFDIKNYNGLDVGDIKSKIERLEKKELEFYQKFGKNSFEQFMNFLREIMSSTDGEVLKRLSNENLRSTLLRDIKKGKTDLTDAEIVVTFQREDAEKRINKILEDLGRIKIKEESLSKRVISRNGRQLRILLNTPTLKVLLNNYVKGAHFKKTSFNGERLSAFLEDHKEEISESFNFTLDGNNLSTKALSESIKYRPLPWGYTNKEIKECMITDPENTKRELEEAIILIKQEINKLFEGASPDLIKAKEKVVHSIFKDGFSIFFVGANWENGLIGAFGEFGTAVLIEYLFLKTGKKTFKSVANIVGQQLGKQDLSLFNSFGVQVKNYHTFKNEVEAKTAKNIEVSQSAHQVSQYFDNPVSFEGFLANFFFNYDIWKRNLPVKMNLEQELAENFQAEVLRFATKEIEDTVVFYNINMQYFLPASKILQFYVDQSNLLTVKINSLSQTTWADGPSTGKNNYWEYDKQGLWKPTGQNLATYDRYIKNDITIKAEMRELNLLSYFY